MSMILKSAILSVALVATAAAAGPGVIIAPTSAVVDSGGPGFGTITDTYNQVGLVTGYVAGVTNFDDYLASNPIHSSVFSPGEFFSNEDAATLQVTYDFGSVKTISALALWNEESSGIGTLDLYSSVDGVNFSALSLGLSPFDNPIGVYYSADVFTFASTSARFVQFRASGCPQANSDFDACAIGEVAFRSIGGAVPEPATWAFMIAGFAMTGFALRRRVAATA